MCVSHRVRHAHVPSVFELLVYPLSESIHFKSSHANPPICLHRYQFNPDLYNPDVVINILIKALTSSPFPDFNLCISLLDERPAPPPSDEPDPLPQLLPLLTQLHALLHQCRFPAFWALYRSDAVENLRDNYTIECVGFEDAVREVAVRAVKAAFTSIGSERLGTYLDLSGVYPLCSLLWGATQC